MNPTPRTGVLSILLNLAGVALVGWALIGSFAEVLPAGMLVTGLVGLAAWLVSIVVSTLATRGAARADADAETGAGAGAETVHSRIILVALAVAAVCGAFIAAPTFGLGIALTVAALLRTIGTPRWPLWWGTTLALVSAALVALGAIAQSLGGTLTLSSGLSAGGLLAIEGGIFISALGGLSRRQYRVAEQQAEALRDERLAAVSKEAALKSLAERQAIAREIHDVLAHSLGGLVIQLDAVDALLESGQTAAAEARVRDARQLAASGLAEARRAVDALREPDAASTVSTAELVASLGELVEAGRALGSPVTFEVSGAGVGAGGDAGGGAGGRDSGRSVSGEAAHALRRAVQESLTNARKHAIGASVSVQTVISDDDVRVRISNPLSQPLDEVAASGGEHGIAGMRERFALLPGGRFRADGTISEFVIEASAMLEP